MRYFYSIRTNNSKKVANPYLYKYGSTCVALHLTKNGFVFEYDRPSKTVDLTNDNLFRDALKKIELIHILKFKQPIKYDSITAGINGLDFFIYNSKTDNPLLYSLISKSKKLSLPSMWNAPVVLQSLLDTPKTKYDRLTASLLALLTAKSKEYESERFMFLWMSMNALYGYLAERYPTKLNHEWEQISLFAKYYGLDYCAKGNAKKNQLRGKTMEFIETASESELADIITKIGKIHYDWEYPAKIKPYVDVYLEQAGGKMDPSAFFLLWLPYQIRCKYFHGEKAFPVLSFADERPIPALRFLNTILEGFLDDELVKWFNNALREQELVPKLKSIK